MKVLHKGITLYNKHQEIINIGDTVTDEYGNSGIVRFGKCTDMTINCGEYDVDYFGFYLDVEGEQDTHVRCQVDTWRKIK